MAERKMQNDPFDLEGPELTSPSIEGPHGPMNHTQPMLDGSLPPDPLGYVPKGEK